MFPFSQGPRCQFNIGGLVKKCQRIMARTVHIEGHSSNKEDHRCDGSRLFKNKAALILVH